MEFVKEKTAVQQNSDFFRNFCIIFNMNLAIRLRRNRLHPAIRSLVEETRLCVKDLVAPLFVIEGTNIKTPISSMPGIDRLSIDLILKKIERLAERGIQAVAIFPSIDPQKKCPRGSESLNPKGLIPNALQAIKNNFPHLCLIADVALDPYTTHGHDGLISQDGEILNDETVLYLCKMAVCLAESGADVVAPSDMMDGRVKAIRGALDQEGLSKVGILSYAIKYASSLYAPFRDAVNVQLKFGDKKSYQLNPANIREAMLEAKLDEEEGADILMVKPASLYLDVIHSLRNYTKRPIAAYHVSGEYSMVMAAANVGILEANKIFYETLLSIKRAGADMIFTYAIDHVLDMLD